MNSVWLKRLAAISVTAVWLAPAAHADCGSVALKNALQADSDRYQIHFRFDPPEIKVGSMFALNVVVCDRNRQQYDGNISAFATMPEHGHGMNTRPEVATSGPGLFRVDGFLFHMPGNWRFEFILTAENSSDVVIYNYELR